MDQFHREYRYRLDRSDTVAILLHGIQGSPRQFDFLIEPLKEVCSVENLLLPGHGDSLRAFNRSSMRAWQRFSDEAVARARREYRHIFLVGHSMGCLLSVQTALSDPEGIRGLFLLAMPLSVRLTWPYVKNSLTVALRRERPGESEIVAAARRGKSVASSGPLGYLGGTPRLYELLSKGVSLRGEIGRLRLPVTAVFSGRDEIVGPKSSSYLSGMENVRLLKAEGSGHYHYTQEDEDRIAQELLQMIREERESAAV